MLFEGMKRAPVSIVAPFEYTSLAWAFGLGFVIWGDVPRREVFLGAALIVAAGLLIIGNEHFVSSFRPTPADSMVSGRSSVVW